MTGSAFLLAFVVLVMLGIGILVSPLFIIPAVVLLIGAVVAGPILGAINARGGGGAGVPTTDEASYEPVQEPHPSSGR